ncbi:hypothetical protein [Christiangramia sabulilitoris]|uniref:hypothetical protein n=1 Tax=Christiangramia sabulilitoris TaxID=2583991 RepID=UPI001179AFCF|nr:hypothetical protein [Christiangramia sabulilitoris]
MHLTAFYPIWIFYRFCSTPVTILSKLMRALRDALSGLRRAFAARFPMKKLGELKQTAQSLTQKRFSDNSKKPQKNSGMISKMNNYVIFNNSFLIAWILKISVHIFVIQIVKK